MTGQVVTRPATAHYLHLLAALHAEAFHDPSVAGPAWDAGAFANLLSMPGTSARLAIRGIDPVGLVLVRVAVDEAEILTIGTVPQVRGQGAARALLAATVAELRQAGVRQLFLEVAERNEAAKRLYAATGFREVGRRRGYYELPGGRQDAVVMRLDLS